MGIFALTDIPVGEELSYDYQFQHYGLAQAAGAYRSVLPLCSIGYLASKHVLVFRVPYNAVWHAMSFPTACHCMHRAACCLLTEPVSCAKCCIYCKSLSRIRPACLFTPRTNALFAPTVCTLSAVYGL